MAGCTGWHEARSIYASQFVRRDGVCRARVRRVILAARHRRTGFHLASGARAARPGSRRPSQPAPRVAVVRRPR